MSKANLIRPVDELSFNTESSVSNYYTTTYNNTYNPNNHEIKSLKMKT